MAGSIAVLPTDKASRYLQQLCKHWSHKFETQFDAEAGRIVLPAGVVTLVSEAGALTVACETGEPERLARLQEVVAEHLNRFAFREGELVFDWRPN